MPKAPIRILIVAALCALSLIGLVVRESAARASGTEVLLAMEAVDPRALLSGHYVIVALTENLAADAACPAGSDGDSFLPAELGALQPNGHWLALRPGERVHSLAGVAASREQALALAPVAVRGNASCTPPTTAGEGVDARPGSVRLDLGVSRFHINQADAQRIDAMLREQTGDQQRVFAIVSVGTDGRARLKGLMVEDERLELSWL